MQRDANKEGGGMEEGYIVILGAQTVLLFFMLSAVSKFSKVRFTVFYITV